MDAGAERLTVSLCNVNDETTASLMTEKVVKHAETMDSYWSDGTGFSFLPGSLNSGINRKSHFPCRDKRLFALTQLHTSIQQRFLSFVLHHTLKSYAI